MPVSHLPPCSFRVEDRAPLAHVRKELGKCWQETGFTCWRRRSTWSVAAETPCQQEYIGGGRRRRGSPYIVLLLVNLVGDRVFGGGETSGGVGVGVAFGNLCVSCQRLRGRGEKRR